MNPPQKILVGFEVRRPKTKHDPGSTGGTPVYITLHHLAAFGMTQKAGKTTLLEALIVRSALRALAFILKRGESGFHNYHTVPPYFKARSDWQWLEGLVNVALGERVKFEPGMRGAIMRVSEGTRGELHLILAKSQKLEKAARRGFELELYHKLSVYLRGVVENMSRFTFSDKLELVQGINVMDLSPMEAYPEIQQLVISAALNQVHETMENVIAVVPEAWEQIPQGKLTPVKWAAERFIRKGAAIGNYLWIDSQDIGGIDKTPLRQVDNWFLGRMKEFHEIERITKQLLGVKLPEGEIETLRLGEFYAVLGNKVHKIYALPAGVPPEIGELVATGRMQPEQVQTKFLRPIPVAPRVETKPAVSEANEVRELMKRVSALEHKDKDTTVKPEKTEAEVIRELIADKKPEEPADHVHAQDPDSPDTDISVSTTPGNINMSTTVKAEPAPAPSEGTMEIHEPVQLILVKDFKGTLTAETTTLMGQVGQLIIDKLLETKKRYLCKDVSRLLVQEFEGQWGEGEIMQALRNLTAPPYRLFVHEIDPARRNWFRLRERAKEQVKET